jgi:Ni,Fe-hydrogenase maturation factor
MQASADSLRLSHQHGVSFAQAIAFGRQCGAEVPDPVVAYAVEVQDPFTFGEELTPAVAQAVEPVAWRVAAEARRLTNHTS